METLYLAQGANIHYTPQLYCVIKIQYHETGRILPVMISLKRKDCPTFYIGSCDAEREGE